MKNNAKSLSQAPKILSHAVLLLAALLLSACVTTTTGGSRAETNVDKAMATHIQLGFNYLRKKNRDLARHHFTKALAIDGRSAGAHNGMALVYQFDGEVKLAEKSFIRALSEQKDFSQARNNYGSFLYQQKRYKEAYEQFEKAAEEVGYNGRPMALVNAGRTALKLDNKIKAKAAFEHALNLNPRLALALIELAELHFDDQEYADAKRFLGRHEELTRPSSRSLWLGIRIERIFNNKDKESSYAMALKNMYPYSKEYLSYQNVTKN